MKRWDQLLVGGFSAAWLSVGVLPAAAQVSQQEYVPAFTPAEWEIIEQEYRFGDYGSGDAIYTSTGVWRPERVIRTGGSGADRWIVLDLGTDPNGNQYRLRSDDQRRVVGADGDFSVIQVFFADPAVRDGVVKRDVVLGVRCRDHFRRGGGRVFIGSYLYLAVFQDFDSNGSVVATRRLGISEISQLEDMERMDGYAYALCQARYGYPELVRLLESGQQRDVPNAPSDFEIF